MPILASLAGARAFGLTSYQPPLGPVIFVGTRSATQTYSWPNIYNKVSTYSRDGVVWTDTTNFPVDAYWDAVWYVNGKFIATAPGINKIAISEDGITWTGATLPFTTQSYGMYVIYGNGVYLAFEKGGNISATSADLITWTQRSLPATSYWLEPLFANGLFLLYKSNESGTTSLYTSTDAISWTARTLGNSSTNYMDFAYGNGVYVVCQRLGIGKYSSNAITWTSASSWPNLSYEWSSVVFDGTRFISIAHYATAGTGGIATSTNGITWTARTLPFNTSSPTVVSIGGTTYLYDISQNLYATTTDGITWTTSTTMLQNLKVTSIAIRAS